MTPQETFDKVTRHLLTQKAVSELKGVGCRYRADNGLKCAVGCLIPDDKYSPDIEGTPVGPDFFDLEIGFFPPRALALRTLLTDLGLSGQGKLLSRLQHVHDSFDSSDWPDRLRRVAKDFNLSTAVLDEMTANQQGVASS